MAPFLHRPGSRQPWPGLDSLVCMDAAGSNPREQTVRLWKGKVAAGFLELLKAAFHVGDMRRPCLAQKLPVLLFRRFTWLPYYLERRTALSGEHDWLESWPSDTCAIRRAPRCSAGSPTAGIRRRVGTPTVGSQNVCWDGEAGSARAAPPWLPRSLVQRFR